MDAAADALRKSFAQLRASLDGVPALRDLEEQSHVPKEYLVAGGAVALVLLVAVGLSAATVCNVAGFAYPAYHSLRALERPVPGGATQWLVYWVVYAFFSVLEVFSATLVHWIPFYYAFKFAFLLWAFLPQTRGAKFLYDHALRDLLKAREGPAAGVDAAVERAKASVTASQANASVKASQANASVKASQAKASVTASGTAAAESLKKSD